MKTITLIYPMGHMEHFVSRYLLDNRMMQEFDNYNIENLGESDNIIGSSVVIL